MGLGCALFPLCKHTAQVPTQRFIITQTTWWLIVKVTRNHCSSFLNPEISISLRHFQFVKRFLQPLKKSVNPWIWDDWEKSPRHAFRRAQQWNNLGLCDAPTWFFHDSTSISTLLPAQSNGGGKGGGKGHTLCLIQSINPPKLVSNPRDTGNIPYSYISTRSNSFCRGSSTACRQCYPSFCRTFGSWQNYQPCQWSLRQNISSSPSSITCIQRGPVSSISVWPPAPVWFTVFNCV